VALVHLPEAVSDTFPVFHIHVLGKCRGTIKVTGDGLSYLPEKGSDGFTFKSHEYLCAVADDRLVVRSGSKTYRFKSAIALTKAENLAQLQRIVQVVSDSRRDARSKNK
jgi:hypothetical protein